MTNAEMTKQTKECLSAALKEQMLKKSLSKITVSELIKICNMNRNTFYYHFEDIYALLKWTLEQEAIEVVKKIDLLINPEEAINFILNYIDENKYIIACAYNSLGYEQLNRFFYQDGQAIVSHLVDEANRRRENPLKESYKEFVTMFFTEAIAGSLIHYIQNKESWSKEDVAHSLLKILDGSMKEIAGL